MIFDSDAALGPTPLAERKAALIPPRARRHSEQYIPTLDGWRAISIGLVLIAHLSSNQSAVLTRLGPFGVSIFFAISGFLITTTILNNSNVNGVFDLREFYWKRFWRLIPATAVYLIVVIALGQSGPPIRVLSCLFFFSNYLPSEVDAGALGHFWSLSMEEQFYFVLPSLLLLCKPRRTLQIAIALIPAIVLWRWWAFLHLSLPDIVPSYRLDYRFDAFCVPCALALALHLKVFPAWIRRFMVPAAGVGLILVTLALSTLSNRSLTYSAMAILLPLAVLTTVFHPKSGLSQLLEFPALRWVGRISYSLYIWQQLFILGTSWSPLVKVAGALAAASASYYLIERPCRRFGYAYLRQAENKVLVVSS